MNCQEVQIQLSEYLDKSLDTIRSKSIDTHLLSCVLCRAEAESLADCIRQLRDLPMVEPPPAFAQRVMAHAREIEIKPPLWQRFFFGAKFAIPVQASAVVLIAVFAALLYQREPALQKSDPAGNTSPVAALPALTKEETVPVAERAQSIPATSSSSAEARLQARSVAERDRQLAGQTKVEPASDAAAFKDRAQAAPQSVASAKTESALGDAGEGAHRAPIQAQEVATGRESFRPGAEAFGAGRVIGNLEQPLFRAPFSAERARSPLSEPASDVEFVVRRRPPEQRQEMAGAAADASRNRGETENALPAAKPAAPQFSSVVEIRWFTVPADRYEQFKKELADEATVESEKSLARAGKEIALKSARDLVIKVMILSPAER